MAHRLRSSRSLGRFDSLSGAGGSPVICARGGPMTLCARLLPLALVPAAFAACHGTIEEGSSGGVQDPPPPGPPPVPATPSPDTTLWRLTRTEYKNSLRDL